MRSMALQRGNSLRALFYSDRWYNVICDTVASVTRGPIISSELLNSNRPCYRSTNIIQRNPSVYLILLLETKQHFSGAQLRSAR